MMSNPPPAPMVAPASARPFFQHHRTLAQPRVSAGARGCAPWRGVVPECEHMFVSDEAGSGGARPRECILHADLDSFYASVEQRDDPSLRGRPVIVGGGVVLAASYEAKAHGVRSAMGLTRARGLCPQAIVVPPRFEPYSAASKAVFAVFADTSPLVEG